MNMNGVQILTVHGFSSDGVRVSIGSGYSHMQSTLTRALIRARPRTSMCACMHIRIHTHSHKVKGRDLSQNPSPSLFVPFALQVRRGVLALRWDYAVS